MKEGFSRIIFALCLMVIIPTAALSWEKYEHRVVADSAFVAVLAECGIPHQDLLVFFYGRGASISLEQKLWEGKTFGEICALSSGNDISYPRFHQRGQTILQQLRPLSASMIDSVWREHSGQSSTSGDTAHGSRPTLFSAEQSSQNVIINYLLHHFIALRHAQMAGQEENKGKEALRRALIYEAMAQSYLSDAFSAGHLLVPLEDMFSRLHPVNNKEAHDFFRNEGVYVINSRGDVWQTFGDKLLLWHAPTKRHVLEACVTSLRELFLVFYVSCVNGEIPEILKRWGESISAGIPIGEMVRRWTTVQDGQGYYSITRMPALLLLPMPVSATWSVRTEKMDAHGIHQRKHFPQLRESGFHDPDLEGIDTEFLYPRAAVPDWMVPELLADKSPRELIRSHPDVASVRYVQKRYFPPSYKGLLLHLSGGMVFKKKGSGYGSLFSLGYGLADDLLVINKVSLEFALMPSLDESRRLLISPSIGFGFKLPAPFHLWETYHFEFGYALGLREPFKDDGLRLAAGIEFPTIPLGFTYVGLTIRLMYQRFSLERTIHGIFLEFILH